MFDRIYKVLSGAFSLPDKDTARSYFLNLRQMFMDLNYLAMDTQEFKDQEAAHRSQNRGTEHGKCVKSITKSSISPAT